MYNYDDDRLLLEELKDSFRPNYNAAPTQTMPVITEEKGSKHVSQMEWGISRKLGRDAERKLFNTRSEKAFDRFWGKTVKEHRCLVPANGFYEWRRTGAGKTPFWIHPKNAALLYFAGIFTETGDGQQQYSIMTTAPNKEMSALHDRMPAVLNKEAREAWLLTGESDTELLSELLRPAPDDSLEIIEVSRDVNYTRNNDGHLMAPVNSA